jgi:formylmethanofuran:tetrahydromethanopterin formyltransferase
VRWILASRSSSRLITRTTRFWAVVSFRCTDALFEGRSLVAMRKIIRSRDKVRLYFGTVKSVTGGRHFMAWANSREHALSLVEAALTATEPVQGSVVGPLMSLRADVMKAGVYVETRPAPKTP